MSLTRLASQASITKLCISSRRTFVFKCGLMDAVSPEKIAVTTHQQYYTSDLVSPTTVAPSPLDQFRIWFTEVSQNESVKEPEAMNLSTATPAGIPSARIVLFKQLDSRGFIFFTNYSSRKSQELLENPRAALVFYWREVHRSVRVVGRVEKVAREESEEYFRSRPIGSRLGAWASKQSTVVGETELHARVEKFQQRFGVSGGEVDGEVPLPDFWGGWRVVPE
jgi:pyridoxamine-phosphate oxidase